ncbi:MAG: Glutamate-ammonia-ligase adenylyltransferase [Pseudomonadota bacterium]|jgi:glutamate-ammonia-ligase adenylyltransferase
MTTQIDSSSNPQNQWQALLPQLSRWSLFIRDYVQRQPQLWTALIDSGDLDQAYQTKTYSQKLQTYHPNSEAELMSLLRHYRRREMVRIACRDLAGLAELSETLHELSWLADACIEYALEFLYRQACEKRGTPLTHQGQAMNIVILGMGKLGAFELNYSSDIDLIFAYLHDGQLNDRKQTSYGEFFSQICRGLIKVLDAITVEGFVFRTDIRLRPFGDSGPLLMTFEGMENYYQTQAREWERYAMIKARPVAGNTDHAQQLMALLKPFVYRRYLDYGAFEELRSLKKQINQELQRKDRLDNIKLGRGGIREIEFIGQAFQLIRGGREPKLQQRGIMAILTVLRELQLLTVEDATQLMNSYCFLRRIENHIQQYQDQQTHDLPKSMEAQIALAESLGFANWTDFIQQLTQVRDQVHEVFEQVFCFSSAEHLPSQTQSLWQAQIEDNELQAGFKQLGWQYPEMAFKQLIHFKQAAAIKRLTRKGAAVLDRLMPKVIEALAHRQNADTTFKRLLDLFETVAGRNVYLALLAENPSALAQLIQLSAASAWLCNYLATYPVLFDELIDSRSLYQPLTKTELQSQLQRHLTTIDSQEEEQFMIGLRQFKHLNILRIAAADIIGHLSLTLVSDYLTYLAETIVESVIDYAWKQLTAKHGFPHQIQATIDDFAIIGLGKFGGSELGYGSDLDLVFLYRSDNSHEFTTGNKPISILQFYVRLGQKIRHILDTKMLSGVLYEIDLRLRPSGNSGLLVAHLDSYETYLHEQAWTWEHQALVRGRFICGDTELKSEYQKIRQQILMLPRDIVLLKNEVQEMRDKMRLSLDKSNADHFDLKHGKGGIVDIEFIVQFLVLGYAYQYPLFTDYTDSLHLIELLANQALLTQAQASILTKAYCQYRDYAHKQVLQNQPAWSEIKNFDSLRISVQQIWQLIFN